MSKLRSVSTSFWSDPFIEELVPEAKLLYLYLITNDKTNMLGVYESSIKKMSFETDISKENIKTYLNNFEGFGKIQYVDNYVILVNYAKHQRYNTNMRKSAISIYQALPDSIKLYIELPNDMESLKESKPVKAIEKAEVVKESGYKYKEGKLQLTHKEYRKLTENHSEMIIDDYINRVANWKNKDKIKSMYFTIIRWISKDTKQQPVEVKKESNITGFNEVF